MTFLTELSPIRWLFLAHAIAGAAALLIFIFPLVSQKGGKLHVRTGWIYTGAMAFVVASTFVLTPWRGFMDPNRTDQSVTFAVFLGYIAIFTLSALTYGLGALRAKNRTTPSRALMHTAFPIATIVAGVFTQLLGLKFNNVLLLAFPFLGHQTAITQLKYWREAPKEKMHWWFAHMSGMGVACIATITAFLVTALPRLWPHPVTHSPVVWIAPGLILGTVFNRWAEKYRKNGFR